MALSLALAIGGLVWLDGGSVNAASYDNGLSSAPAPDADSCSTTGWYNPGSYFPGGEILVPTVTNVPVGSFPYWGWGPWGYPMGTTWTVPVVTATSVIVPPGPELPNYSQPYLAGTSVNYACNSFNNCVPLSDAATSICPGNPSAIALNNATSATCASAMNIEAKVVGPGGLIVADGTPVLFTTTLGMIPGSTSTDGGIASVSLVFPTKTQGTATVTATAGTAKAETRINVTC
jgi:hypothetical protein